MQGLEQEDLSVILKEEAEAEEGEENAEAKAETEAETEERRGKTKPKLAVRPEVRCVFVTEFAGHVLISVNADILVFLQNLVKSYLSEKIQEDSRKLTVRFAEGRVLHVTVFSGTSSLFADSATTGSPMVKDVRLYNCIKWQLNPTIRFVGFG